MIITHNLAAMNTMNKLNATNKSLNKSTERLSSGYRINRAADDAAGLSISEKKRAQIRGLMRSARNSEEGIDFVRTGDGAMSEMSGLLQRMRELTVQSLNDAVLTPQDRACLQMEFESLQSEIDRLNDQSEYNTQAIFEHYADEYAIFEGNMVWPQNQPHIIVEPDNTLKVKYTLMNETGAEAKKEMEITVPPGTYTTQELIDEIDDVVSAFRDSMDVLALEFTKKHTCNMVVQNENVKEINDVSGGLSYLFFGSFGGNNTGSLIGTTQIYSGYPLDIVTGKNDELRFKIEYFDGTEKPVEITVPQDSYSRQDMINYLNTQLDGTGMKAEPYGDYYVQIGGTTGIITGLKGNMFEIDPKTGQSYDSVFYDNTKYGSATEISAVFSGGYVLPKTDSQYSQLVFSIDGTNNTLKMSVDGSDFKTITLDTKNNYSMNDMVTQLQQKFDAAFGAGAVKVTSSETATSFKTPNGTLLNFKNIVITSQSKGENSDITFDTTVPNGAYETLFTDRSYTDIGRTPYVTSGSYSAGSTIASITSSKSFHKGSFPMTFTDTNNSFTLKVTEQGKEPKEIPITLPAATPFNSLSDIANAINTLIANSEFKGKITATTTGTDQLQIRHAYGNNTVTAIDASGPAGSAYDILFAGTSTSYPNTTSVTLNEITKKPPLDDNGNITFTAGNNKLNVTIAGEVRNVEVEPKTYTAEELAKELTEKLKGVPKTSDNNYYAQTGYGSTASSNSYPFSDTTGKINEKPGTGGKDDGSTIIAGGTGGSCEIGTALKPYTVIDSSNNSFSISINGKRVDITIPTSDSKGYTNGYTQAQLAKEIQDQINAKVSEANQIKVTTPGGRLTFTTVAVGSGKTISLSGCSSSFLSDINRTVTPASATTGSLPSSSFPLTLSPSNNKFTINVDGHDQTVSLDAREYSSASDMRNEIISKVNAAGLGVTAESYGSGIKYTRDVAESGKSVSVNTGSSGANELIFKAPASTTLNINKDPVELPPDKDATFKVTINGTTHTATIPATSAGRKLSHDDLLNELNNANWSGGKNFTITKNGSGFKFTTDKRGEDVRVSASATAGQTTYTPPSIEAEVKSEGGKMTVTLKSVPDDKGNKTPFSPSPYNSLQILQPAGQQKPSSPEHSTRKFTATPCKLTTQRPTSLPGSVTLTAQNNVLEFDYYYHSGGSQHVKIELDIAPNGTKTYSRSALQQALQKALDKQLETAGYAGEGLNVAVGDQITMTSKQGGNYRINNLTGGFYTDIMMGTTVREAEEKPSYTDGGLLVDDVYIAGRKDVRNNTTKIQKDDNDTLSIDLTIDGVTTTLEMKLAPGSYNADALVAHIQGKLDEAVEKYNQDHPASPLPEGIVKTGIGTFDTGVKGAVDDKNSLFFYINKEADLKPGSYGIDGLGGKALFSIFYKTNGDPFPAYIAGAKDITKDTEIKPGVNDEFSIDVDGVTYKYTIPEGKYTGDELVEKLNELFKATPDAKIKADYSGNALKISYMELGEHKLSNIQGNAKSAIFYNSDSRTMYDSSLNIQVGANSDQLVNIEKFSMSTLNMGINSITISRQKYASKALERLDDAMNYLNERRSRYGAMQNRLGYAVDGNDITAENTQASESINRDANIAAEMVRFAASNILQQAGMSMLAQANQQTGSILSLLR